MIIFLFVFSYFMKLEVHEQGWGKGARLAKKGISGNRLGY